MFEDEDVDKSVVVVGGFSDQALEDAEVLVQQMMVGIAGFKDGHGQCGATHRAGNF